MKWGEKVAKKSRLIDRVEVNLLKNICAIQHEIEMRDKKAGVLIFGAGLECRFILNCLELSSHKVFVCDTFCFGKTIEGIKVEKPSKELMDSVDVILIASENSYDEIMGVIEKNSNEDKVISVYGEEEKPFWYKIIEVDTEEYYKKCIAEQKIQHSSEKEVYGWYRKENFGKIFDERREKVYGEKSFSIDISSNIIETDRYKEYIEETDDVLEVGAGTGRLTKQLTPHCKSITAVDTSEEMLKELKKKAPSVKTYKVEGIELPFEDNCFDKVISCELMCHLDNMEDFLKEHVRVLKRGGLIIHSIINRDHVMNISSDEDVVEWYLASEVPFVNDRFSTYNRNMIEQICDTISELELEKMVPYGFFNKTVYGEGFLGRTEMNDLSHMYYGLSHVEPSSSIIRRFESEIVSRLPEHYASSNLVVLRKV